MLAEVQGLSAQRLVVNVTCNGHEAPAVDLGNAEGCTYDGDGMGLQFLGHVIMAGKWDIGVLQGGASPMPCADAMLVCSPQRVGVLEQSSPFRDDSSTYGCEGGGA
eukprot:2077132-Pleurochrysis_carterae.AAC.1